MTRLTKLALFSTLISIVLLSSFGRVSVSSIPPLTPIGAPFFGVTIAALSSTWPVTVPFGTLGKTASGGPPGGTYWLSLEPSNGTFDWAPLDKLIAEAKGGGISDIVYTLYETPTWASSNPTQGCFATQRFGILGCAAPPKSISDWDTFVTALVNRYKGQIQYYEVWNEPNVSTEYSGNITEMVTLAQHAYTIIKSIDPSAFVLAPGVSVAGTAPYTPGCSPSLCWLAEYFQAGGGKYADGVDFHGKTCLSNNFICTKEGIACSSDEIEACAGSSLIAQINSVRSLMATYGVSDKFLMDTEGGYSEEVGEQNLWGTPDQQTAFVSRFFIIQASENLRKVVWFSWLMNKQSGLLGFGTSPAEAETNEGYEQTHAWLIGATFSGPCSLSDGVWTCGITNPQGYQELVVWSDTNSSASTYTPPSQYTQYLDLAGQVHPISIGAPVGVDEKPILLESTSATTSSSSSSGVSEFPMAWSAVAFVAVLISVVTLLRLRKSTTVKSMM